MLAKNFRRWLGQIIVHLHISYVMSMLPTLCVKHKSTKRYSAWWLSSALTVLLLEKAVSHRTLLLCMSTKRLHTFFSYLRYQGYKSRLEMSNPKAKFTQWRTFRMLKRNYTSLVTVFMSVIWFTASLVEVLCMKRALRRNNGLDKIKVKTLI